MTEPGTAFLPQRRGRLCFGLCAALALAGAAALAQGQRQGPVTAMLSATSAPVPAATSAPATPAPADEPAARAPDRERRMLLFLLAHSTGPLGPYGALGR